MSVHESPPVEPGSFPASILEVDGDLLLPPHEQAWREALRGFTDPNLFTTGMFRTHVEGKPELVGAREALEALGVPDAGRLAVLYADRKQRWLAYFIQEAGVATLPGRIE